MIFRQKGHGKKGFSILAFFPNEASLQNLILWFLIHGYNPQIASICFQKKSLLPRETQSRGGQASISISAELQQFCLHLSAQHGFRMLSVTECAAGQWHHSLTEMESLPIPEQQDLHVHNLMRQLGTVSCMVLKQQLRGCSSRTQRQQRSLAAPLWFS